MWWDRILSWPSSQPTTGRTGGVAALLRELTLISETLEKKTQFCYHHVHPQDLPCLRVHHQSLTVKPRLLYAWILCSCIFYQPWLLFSVLYNNLLLNIFIIVKLQARRDKRSKSCLSKKSRNMNKSDSHQIKHVWGTNRCVYCRYWKWKNL